jgi:hypothetical protein
VPGNVTFPKTGPRVKPGVTREEGLAEEGDTGRDPEPAPPSDREPAAHVGLVELVAAAGEDGQAAVEDDEACG